MALASAVVLCPGCAGPQGGGDVPPAVLEASFRETLNDLHKAEGIPGATAAFILQDGSAGHAAAGYADVERGITMTPDRRMLAGSVGKMFVAALALKLAREGELDLDAPVSQYLSTAVWFDRLPNHGVVTLRHLLTHSAGLLDHVFEPGFASLIENQVASPEFDPDWRQTPEELVGYALGTSPLFEAGRGYSYTDTGYIVAGLSIEAATGQSYYDTLEARLLEPLELDATSPSDRRRLDGLTAGYVRDENQFGLPAKIAEGGVMRINPATEWTGGGLITHSGDLVRWAKALFEEDVIEGFYLEELIESGFHGPDGTHDYGLGVQIRETPHGEAWGHTGWFPGYTSAVYYYPSYGVAVALQTNTADAGNVNGMVDRLAAAVVGRGR